MTREKKFSQLSNWEKYRWIEKTIRAERSAEIAEINHAHRCDREEERRKAIRARKRERREVQEVLIEVIAGRKFSPSEITRISEYSRTYILALSKDHFTPEEHQEFLAMDQGVSPAGPRTPRYIDDRTEDEKWLDWYDAWADRRMAAVLEMFRNGKN
jgi:hypothetical protein